MNCCFNLMCLVNRGGTLCGLKGSGSAAVTDFKTLTGISFYQVMDFTSIVRLDKTRMWCSQADTTSTAYSLKLQVIVSGEKKNHKQMRFDTDSSARVQSFVFCNEQSPQTHT